MDFAFRLQQEIAAERDAAEAENGAAVARRDIAGADDLESEIQ